VVGGLVRGERFALDPSVVGHFRPSVSLPAYAGFLPVDGVSPIVNFFDRVGGGRGYRGTVTRRLARDWRGGRLTYDEHDGTDFVCPPQIPIVAAAPGVLVATRDTLLRGGLTAMVDHGHGVVTQYTHLTRVTRAVGEPLRRGDEIGWSGTAGLDMISGAPWVPPHVHFMVWIRGEPVDPYLADGEPPRPGTWLHGNAPETSGPLPDDDAPPTLDAIAVDERALDAAMVRCTNAAARGLLERAPTAAARLALLEDMLHHDRYAFSGTAAPVRPPGDAARVRLTLPLPRSDYRRARACDTHPES
jgi:hypothetical protein